MEQKKNKLGCGCLIANVKCQNSLLYVLLILLHQIYFDNQRNDSNDENILIYRLNTFIIEQFHEMRSEVIFLI